MTSPITSENEFNQLKLEFLRLQLNQKREKFKNIQRKIDSTEDLKANEKSQLDKIMKLNLIADNRFELTNWENIEKDKFSKFSKFIESNDNCETEIIGGYQRENFLQGTEISIDVKKKCSSEKLISPGKKSHSVNRIKFQKSLGVPKIIDLKWRHEKPVTIIVKISEAQIANLENFIELSNLNDAQTDFFIIFVFLTSNQKGKKSEFLKNFFTKFISKFKFFFSDNPIFLDAKKLLREKMSHRQPSPDFLPWIFVKPESTVSSITEVLKNLEFISDESVLMVTDCYSDFNLNLLKTCQR